MLGMTSIDLSSLENLRSIWVVVIGLELFSLACPGLDLGSVMLHYLCHPCYYYGYVDPNSVENRIWGDGNGICWCDANGSGLCPVRCWKPVDSYHTQIYGPVHGATTHENSITMSLYGYGLA
jgi:hypothetical protein